MTETAKLANRARAILGKQLSVIEREVDDPTTKTEHVIPLVAPTVSILQALDKAIESSGKLLTTKSPVVEESPIVSAEQVLAEITKGKKGV